MPGLGMFDKILKFEHALAEFTGAPYVIMTDCCTLNFVYAMIEYEAVVLLHLPI